ncbi:MAG: 2,3-bisphosphoglycerate-independent phosphoglycerate mutase [Burkholderiales bacterium]|nr:2,3-bisphosphoglycerate-independent phosphoglycerate mutase [Burkholderiales bacterium]
MTVNASPVTPALLIILDGFGHRAPAPDNAIELADTPNWDRLWAHFPHTLIEASELHVGLPAGQMGNSEVGHLNIGAGRVVYQDYTRIELAIQNGDFARNPALAEALALARANRSTVHVLGLLSPGGVHSHELQLQAMVAAAAAAGVPAVAVHAFLDGRDTPPQSAKPSLQSMIARCAELTARTGSACRVATIAGRYYAMDRDQRWERVHAAYDCIVAGASPHRADDAVAALEAAYGRDETDEFVKPTVIGAGAPVRDGDVVVFMNFRADRARELSLTLIDPDFRGFARTAPPRIARLVTLTHYSDDISANPLVRVAFAPQDIVESFGEVVAAAGLRQLRIAETEKYAHVTYFFSGGREAPFPGEERILVPSPKVATYDLKPEMSAFEVTDRLVAAIESKQFAAIVCNFANSDMVGHTGQIPAAVKAIEALDVCIGRAVAAQRAAGGEVLITADHGNAEMMFDPVTGQPHTAHTLLPVPFVYIGRAARMHDGGSLQDVAPTLLRMMGLPQPAAMTGRPLLEFVQP